MKKCILLSLLFFNFFYSFAQKEANIWCFGNEAGINFNSGSPVSFSGVAMSQIEGCSSIADINGSLLFYTDGITIWNKNNLPMPNGNSLLGGSSSSESAMIIKQPGNANIYYVITADEFPGTKGLNYSVVDINLQSGLGDVSTKNINLLSACDERITAVRHANGTDVWIISTTGNAGSVKAFLLTAAGINMLPVTTSTGTSHTGSQSSLGYLKASASGKLLAVAYEGDNGFDLYKFNDATGIISSGLSVQDPDYITAYGIEFSADETKLYLSTVYPPNLFQFDISNYSASIIANSAVLIASFSSVSNVGALQMAPDGKIYLARYTSPYLGVINKPDLPGFSCMYVDQGFNLGSGTSLLGLPNLLPFIFSSNPLASFSVADTIICVNTCLSFSNGSTGATSYYWNFPGGTPSSSTAVNPLVCYNNAGKYNVQLIAFNGGQSDTLVRNNYVTVNPLPEAGIVSSTSDSICEGTGLTSALSVTGSSGNLQWQSSVDSIHFIDINGATSQSYTTSPLLSQTTYYRVMAKNNICPPDSSNIVAFHILASPFAYFNYTANGMQVTFNSTGTSSDVISYNWDFGDGSISTDANPAHTYSVKDTFQVCLTVFNGSNCSYTLCQYVDLISTGISDPTSQNKIELYPNPAGNQLTVSSEQLTVKWIEIKNVLGQTLITQFVKRNTQSEGIDVSVLPTGFYFITIHTGDKVITKKFVKE